MFSSLENYPILKFPHDVLRHDTAEEVKAHRDDLLLQRKAQRQAEGKPQYPVYAFTEITTVKLRPSNVDVTSMATDEGKAFAEYIKTILETAQGLSRLLWGYRIEAPEMVVVLLDWVNFESRENMQQEPKYKVARNDLQAHLAGPISSRAFDFQNADSRIDCFGRRIGDLRPTHLHTTFYVWDFQTPSRDVEFVLPQQDSSSETLLEGADARYYEIVESSTDTDGRPTACSREEDTAQDNKQYMRTFDLHWEHFALQYFRFAAYPVREPWTGPCLLILGHQPKWGGGWEVLLSPNGSDRDGHAYCGVVGTLHNHSARYLDQIHGKSYEEGGLAPLQSIATGGLDIFHVELHCLTSWQGSVLPPPRPVSQPMRWRLPHPPKDGEQQKHSWFREFRVDSK